MVKIRERLKNFLDNIGSIVFSLEKPCTSKCPGYVCPDCGYKDPCSDSELDLGKCNKFYNECLCRCPPNCEKYIECTKQENLDQQLCWTCNPYCTGIVVNTGWKKVGTSSEGGFICEPKTCVEAGYYDNSSCNNVCPTPTPTPPPTPTPTPTPPPTYTIKPTSTPTPTVCDFYPACYYENGRPYCADGCILYENPSGPSACLCCPGVNFDCSTPTPTPPLTPTTPPLTPTPPPPTPTLPPPTPTLPPPTPTLPTPTPPPTYYTPPPTYLQMVG